MRSRTALAAALGALAAAAPLATAGDAPARTPLPSGPMSILYATTPEVRALTGPGAGAPLGVERGVYRQDPGPGGMLDPLGRDADHRLGKVSVRDMAAMSAEEIAAHIRRESDFPEVPNNTGLVGVDEIGNSFNDGRVPVRYKTVLVRGKKYRIAAHNRIVLTRTGWRLVRGRPPATLPKISPDSIGARFSEAMRILDATPHAAGGSYADRVHLYIAPAFVSSIGVGRGPHRNLGPDGKPHRATWRGVMPALARAGGIWLEMYHYNGRTVRTMAAPLWRMVPRGFSSYARRFGADPSRIHFLFSGATDVPRGAPRRCGDAMACQWALARSTPAGRAILANGAGAYRPATMAGALRAEFNRQG